VGSVALTYVAHLAHVNRKSPGQGPVIEMRQTTWEERVNLTGRGIGQPLSFIMSEDVVRFYKLAEVCRDRATQARNSIDEEAWLKLADDWLELARANEKPRQSPATRRAASD
jgi:hypothetical protein